MFNIQSAYTQRITPSYAQDTVDINFENELKYENWYNDVATQHGNWIINEHKSFPANEKYVGSKTLVTPLPFKSTVYVCDHMPEIRKKVLHLPPLPPLKEFANRQSKSTVKQDLLNIS